MSRDRALFDSRGPFRADQLRSGDPYELSQGHPVVCLPTGGRGAQAKLLGAAVLGTDPAVEQVGVDVGFALSPDTMRAPGIAIGNIPYEPGWAPGAPVLAVEYADRDQNEDELQQKITALLAAGTRAVWVVRLYGGRWIEVVEPGMKCQTLNPGENLLAPGILKNPVPVEALYDREAALDAMLRNLLQRLDTERVEAIRQAGREEGLREGLQRGIQAICEVLGIEINARRGVELQRLKVAELHVLLKRLRSTRSWPY